jgi:hypothetical protein
MKRSILSAAVVLAFAAAPVALADHMSPHGMCWANMPNDIHNTRLATRDLEDGNTIFQDFVQHGEGADVPNTCPEDDVEPMESEVPVDEQ